MNNLRSHCCEAAPLGDTHTGGCPDGLRMGICSHCREHAAFADGEQPTELEPFQDQGEPGPGV